MSLPDEERFSNNAKIMCEEVYTCIFKLHNEGYTTVDPNMIKLATGLIGSFDKHYLIQGFITKSHINCWDSIKSKNENFFLKHAGEIFGFLPMEKVNIFKDLFTMKDKHGKNIISDSFKEYLWKIFASLVKISIKYIHNNRLPYSYMSDKGLVEAYRQSFFDEVDISRHSKIWDLKLEFTK